MVVDILPLAGARFPSKRPDCLDTAAHCSGSNHFGSRLAVGPEFQIPAWNFADACNCCALGNSSADSNSRRILCDRNRTTCHWPLARDDGRARSEFVWDVSTAFAVLFRDSFHRFLSVVDQVAVVDPAIAEPKEDRDP